MTDEAKKGWFRRLKDGLSKSAGSLTEGITSIITKRKLDDAALEDLEDLLVMADLGVGPARRLTDSLRKSRFGKDVSDDEIKQGLADEVTRILEPVAKPIDIDRGHKPHVILMVGVNGSGKTTTIGKMAKQFQARGKSVMLAAGDTFRAAAIEQLQIWGERAGVPVVTGKEGGEAASLAYDAMDRAQSEGVDVLIIDTAGRLQNRTELMAELEKVVRVISKKDETAPHDTLLVLDATTGQNAVMQAKAFTAAANVSGLVMTKLDGSAKGGVLVALADQFSIPIHAIGVGEDIEDLQAFNAAEFAKALTGVDTSNETSPSDD